MRTLLLVSLFLVSNVLFAQHYSSFIKDLPIPNRVVNDFGGFFTPNQKSTLEDSLVSYRRRTGNAIVIITLSTLTDHKTGTTWSVEETALQYFSKWGIGDRNKNNGVLLLISKEPRRVRITTGSGVDKILTDNECQRIIGEAIVPDFKLGKFYTGIKTGIHDIESVLDSKVQPEPDEANRALTPVGAQPQSLIQTQVPDADAKKKEPTAGDFVMFLCVLAVMAWLRVLYIRSKRKKDAEANGTSIDSSNNTVLMDWLSATGWAFLWLCFWWILIFIWYRRRGSSSYSSSFSNSGNDSGNNNSYNSAYDRGNSYSNNTYSNGYDDGYDRRRQEDRYEEERREDRERERRAEQERREEREEQERRKERNSNSGSSSSGSGSYGGGRSDGGGATGSW